MGTTANRKVKDYIKSEFAQLNIPTEDFDGHCQIGRQGYKRIARTENIIARIKGTGEGKALYLCGHYDSVLEGPGAADDVHAIACMIEVARVLKKTEHQNDVVFLITDGEEMGLLGAQAYTETQDLSEIGLILNYEARGNSGPSISFEWADNNGWLVEQVRDAGKRPIASSLSYEIYKLLPNDTDYTRFKAKNVPGINHAFIEGFSYYHNPEDKLETINMSSVCHTGINMLSLAEHFSDLSLEDVAAPNAAFFNILGGMVKYPASWNSYLFVLLSLLVLLNFFFSIKQKQFRAGQFIASFILLLVSIALVGGLGYAFGKLLFAIYPQYDVFYAGQYYNHMWYLLSMMGIGLMVLPFLYSFIVKKFGDASLTLSSLLLLTILSFLLLLKMSTGSYILIIPALVIAIGFLIRQTVFSQQSTVANFMPYLVCALPIIMLLPLLKNFYLAFSIAGMVLPAIYFSITCLVFVVPFTDFFTKNKWLPFLGFGLFLVSMIVAHANADPSDDFPMLSSLSYLNDVENEKTYWVTEDTEFNIGNESYFPEHESRSFNVPNPVELKGIETSKACLVDAPLITVVDSSVTLLRLDMKDECYQTRLRLKPENIKRLSFNNYDIQLSDDNSNYMIYDIYGMTQDSLVISLDKFDITQKVQFERGTRYLKIPEEREVPPEARRVDGYTNIVQRIDL